MKNLFLLLVLSGLCVTTFAQNERKIPSSNVKSLDGSNFNTSELNNDGNPMVINFWATWCSPCKKELSAINEVYPDWQEETGVKLVAISIDDARSDMRVLPYVNGQAWDYEVYIDSNQEFKRALNVNNVPHTFLVDGEGNIVWQHNNYAPGDEDELYRRILELSKK